MNRGIRRCPKGSMALASLIAVAIMAIMYMVLISAILPPGSGGGASAIKQDRPWRLEHLLIPSDKLIDMPKPPKLAIDEDFVINAAVSRQESQRGIAILNFDDSGEVSGKWQCDYMHESREYGFIATYAGNIVADKDWVSTLPTGAAEGGEVTDETLLFFIVKGTYTQRVYHIDSGELITEGIIYLSGWVGTDKSLKGLLTITTDNIEDKDKWAASYNLAADPSK